MRLAILAAMLLVAVPAAAETELSVGPVNRSLRSASANAVTDANLVGVQFAAARQLHLDLVTGLQLWATGAVALGFADGTTFDMATQVDSQAFSVGARARYALRRHVVVHGRLDGGPLRAYLGLDGLGQYVSDAGWGAFVAGAVGVDLLLVARESRALGLRVEAGYLAATGIALAPARASRDEMIELPTTQASIGHLDLGGRFYGFSLIAQF